MRAKKKERKDKDWIELCEYVKKEILEYDDNIKFPKHLALILKGIERGEYIGNNKHISNANYDYYTILCTFKLCKKKIVTYLHENEKRIHNEDHKINLIMKMIEPEINDVYIRIQRAKKTQSKVEQQSFDNQSNESAVYVKKTKEINKKMKKLF